MIAASAQFRRAQAGLVAVAFLAPFSATRLAGPLTVGRAAALAFALLLAADAWPWRPWRMRPGRAAALALAGYLGLLGWILLSAVAWGCNCDGKLGGFAELAFVGVLALTAISLAPRLRRPAVLATLCGLVLAAALALVGVGSINSATVDLTQTGGRLSGTYGNANELGLATALGIPIVLALLPAAGRRGRIAGGAALLVLGLALLLTFSRGGIIAAGVGAVAVAVWHARGSRRRIALVLAGAGVAVLIAAVAYSLFERERREASFSPVSPALRPLDERDLSGWDSRALGPIPHGPSRLLDGPEGLVVRGAAGEGVSFRWGEAGRRGTYTLRFRARSAGAGRLPFGYALGDAAQAGGDRLATAVLGPRWRRLSLAWRPRSRARQATLYLWQRGPGGFAVADVAVVARPRGRPAHVVEPPSRLEGSIYDRLTALAGREERRYVRSRLEAARLALEAFGSQPLRGIGWSTFPDYAAAHLDYGPLAVHDEYLAFAAELGLVGLALLGLLIAAVVCGVRGMGAGAPETAALGVLAAAAAGMVFVEALPVPQLSVAVAVALAVVCGRPAAAGRAADPRRDSATGPG